MDELFAVVTVGVMFAFVIERALEKFVKPVLPEKHKEKVVVWIAFFLGIGAAFAFGIDMFAPVLEQRGIVPPIEWAGTLVSGIAIGGGSNFIHDIWPE